MALFSVDFYSKSLFRPVNFKLFVPNDVPPEMKMGNTNYERPTKILALLHGYNGGNLDWALYSNASEISSKYNLAVILPSGENSFYLDSEVTGHKYATFVGQELIDYVRNTFHLSSRKEDTFVGGLSMGGFGAIHTALQFPDTFEKAFSLSGALIVHNVEKMAPGFKDMMANYDYYKSVFGDPAFVRAVDTYRAETGDNNVYTFKYCRMSPMDPIGACGHPSELTQQKMAKELVAFIQALEKRTVIE